LDYFGAFFKKGDELSQSMFRNVPERAFADTWHKNRFVMCPLEPGKNGASWHYLRCGTVEVHS